MASPRILNQESGHDAIEGPVVGLPVLLHHRLYSHTGESLFNYNDSVGGLGSARALSSEVRAGLLQRQTRTALLRRRSRSSAGFKRRNSNFSFSGQDDMMHGHVVVLPVTPPCLLLRGQGKLIHHSKPNIVPTHLHLKHRHQSSRGHQGGPIEPVDGDMPAQKSVAYSVETFDSVQIRQPPRTAPMHANIRGKSRSDNETQKSDSTAGLPLTNINTCKVVPYRQQLHIKHSNNAMAGINKIEISNPPRPPNSRPQVGFNGKTEYTQDERTLTLSVFLPREDILDKHIPLQTHEPS